jgi:cytidine deaminase
MPGVACWSASCHEFALLPDHKTTPIHLMTDLEESASRELLFAARAAVAKAFLTKEGGVRYGAAVLTLSGRVFSCGQYSSFNHSTNVHAEQAALVAAAMQGEPDVVALAVSSTGSDTVTRPCGVCRQIMLEHATRTGRDFAVFMDSKDGRWEHARVSDLLPHAWTAASQSAGSVISGTQTRPSPGPGQAWNPGDPLEVGDHVLLRDGIMALVWDLAPWPGQILVKFKYQRGGDGWHKLAHAFTAPLDYERQLFGLQKHWTHAPCGAAVACLTPGQIQRRFPALSVTSLPPVFQACLTCAAIPNDAVRISGSSATGMGLPGSDMDLVLRVTPDQALALRHEISLALNRGTLGLPLKSGSWRLLERVFPSGGAGILSQGRWVGTFKEGSTTVSLMLAPADESGWIHDDDAVPQGHTAVTGVVRAAERTLFKRAEFSLALADGSELPVISYHKAANLIRSGDFISARGWLMLSARQPCLLQFHQHRDNLCWFTQS